MKITFVKKLNQDGSYCRKCVEVENRLARGGLLGRIDQTAVADPGDPASEGMRLARQFGISQAPFFIVEEGADTEIYTVYFKFVREVLEAKRDGMSALRRCA